MRDEQPDLFGGQRVKRSRMGRPHPVAGGSSPATDAEAARLAAQQATLRQLEPVVFMVAYPGGGEGARRFTMAMVRTTAEELGLLTGEEGRPNGGTGRLETPRALAFLGALLPGLARLGMVEKITDDAGRTVYETSTRERANGNKQALWKLTARGQTVREHAGRSWGQLRENIEAFRVSLARERAAEAGKRHAKQSKRR